MPMPPYPVGCYAVGCGEPACFKIAAQWSDGIIGELKTYSLSCQNCLAALFADARLRRDRCRLAAGETISQPRIYELCPGTRDRKLRLREDLEQESALPG